MRQLFTLAYPAVSAEDARFIEEFRRSHDSQHGLVKAHFTLLFGASGVGLTAYLAHVRDVARNLQPIPFKCRYAMLGADDAAERGSVQLVPDEGFADICRLHDALYRGAMAPLLRLDVPYVPHITMGSSADRSAMKELCDGLNRVGIDLRGTLDRLTVAALEGGSLSELATVALG